MTIAELQAKRAKILAELSRLQPDKIEGHAERQANLTRGLTAVDTAIDAAQQNLERVRRAAGNPANTEQGFSYLTPEQTDDGRQRGTVQAAIRDSALRAIDSRSDIISAGDGDRLVAAIDADTFGLDGAYLVAVCNRAYASAFGKILANPTTAHLQFDSHEAEAMRAAMRASQLREQGAPMSGGTDFMAGPLGVTGGGLPAPVQVDPSLLTLDPGVSDPIRDNATVVSISGYKYVRATGGTVTAAFGQEGTEVADSTPVVAPLSIVPQRATAFVQYSIESSQDWNASGELGQVMSYGKQDLEADRFINGAGETSYQPSGILTGGTVTTSAAGTATPTVADLTGAQNALAPRWQANAAWYGNLTLRNQIDQMVAQASTTAAKITDDQGNILHRPYRETSSLPNWAHSAKPLIYGDLGSAYTIADRLGTIIEIIPHMVGSNRLPLGVRGLYMQWRTSAKVMVPAAIRVVVCP
ncbi:MAG: phage major capsid protein [Solirubrobacteraceae bacterium]